MKFHEETTHQKQSMIPIVTLGSLFSTARSSAVDKLHSSQRTLRAVQWFETGQNCTAYQEKINLNPISGEYLVISLIEKINFLLLHIFFSLSKGPTSRAGFIHFSTFLPYSLLNYPNKVCIFLSIFLSTPIAY